MRRTWHHVCALLMMALACTEANGSAIVYFTTSNPSANVVTISSGGEFDTPRLFCEYFGFSTCEVNVDVWYRSLDGGAYGWGLDLDPEVTFGNGQFSVTNFQIPSNPLNQYATTPTLNQPGGPLIEFAGGGNLEFGGVGPGLYNIMKFRLVFTPYDFAGVLNAPMYAGIGGVEFGGNDPGVGGGFYESVWIGLNGPMPGIDYGPWPIDKLSIPVLQFIIPEPASFAMAAFGTLIILRRPSTRLRC